MKKLLLLVTATFLLIGCGKEKKQEEKESFCRLSPPESIVRPYYSREANEKISQIEKKLYISKDYKDINEFTKYVDSLMKIREIEENNYAKKLEVESKTRLETNTCGSSR